MRRSLAIAGISLALLLSAAPLSPSLAQNPGPDVIVGEIPDAANYGSSGGISAFSLGTTSCNLGTQVLSWVAGTNQHPVIAQNLYRLDQGHFVQVGQSWLKHGFTALQQSLCGPCQAHPTGNALGIGCSDPYGAGLNGSQSGLGPRSQVNATNGFFPYPFTAPSAPATIGRRLQVPNGLLSGASPQAVWLAEAQYIHPQDAASNNDLNNASYALAGVSGGGSSWTLSIAGATQQQKSAILGWQDLDPAVLIQHADIPSDGRMTLGIRRTDNGDGTWHFVYALHNLNSDASAGSLDITFPTGTSFTNAGHHAVHSHSGEPYNNNPWTLTTAPNGIGFAVDLPFTFSPNANALRWGTMYTFWFDADDPDPTGAAIGLFKTANTFSLPAPTFPTPSWQENQAGASLDIDGLVNNGFSGPINAQLASGTNHVLNLGGAAGQAFDILVTAVPGVPSFLVTAGGQILNTDVTDPSFTYLFGLSLPALPAAAFQIPFTAPNVTTSLTLQSFVTDPASVDGLRLSALNDVAIAPCSGSSQTLQLSDDDSVSIAVGPGTPHDCVGPISFGGSTWSSLFVNSNGSASFGAGSTDYFASSATFNNGMPRLAGLWSDLNPGSGGTVTVSSTPAGILTVAFANVPQFSGGGGGSFQLEFDSVAGSCAILGYSPSPGHSTDTLVGLNPGPGGSASSVNWASLIGSPYTGTGGCLYQYTQNGAPSGFSSILFPNADTTSAIVQ